MKKWALMIAMFLVFTGCAKEKMQVGALEETAMLYVDSHIKVMEETEANVKELGYDTYVFVSLMQQDDYLGNNLYLIYYTESLDSQKKPSKIIKYKNRHIVFYLNDSDMVAKYIPKELKKDVSTFWTEGYWALLVCKDNNSKYIAVDNDAGFILEGIDQLKDFKCDSL